MLHRKIKLLENITQVFMKLVTVLGTFAIVVLFFFGFIFALAASFNPTRIATSAILFAVGLAVAGFLYYTTRKPKTVLQQVEFSGPMKAVAIKCPNCSASVDANQIKILSGVPYAKCHYCGTTFEVTEEPKW
jgi:predicted Zn finger-like uncharacterized protein